MGIRAIFLLSLFFSGNPGFNGCQSVGVQHPQECSQDSDCPVNSACEVHRCRCTNGFLFSGDGTRCLRVAESYGDSCEESLQCSSYLSAGGTCTSGRCACSPGFHYLHGFCYKKSELGETCFSSDNCYVNYQPGAAICENNKCRCSSEFYQREYRSCRRAAQKIGEDCAIDIDCKFDARATCDKSRGCQLNDSGTSVVERLEFSPRRAVKLNPEWIKKSCKSSSDCSSMGSATCSSHGTCVCDRAHFLSGTGDKCIPELGEPCTPPELPQIKNSVCREDVWSCKSTHVPAISNRECKKATTRYRTSCLFQEQCFVFGPDAVCTDRKCVCNDKSHYVDDKMFCWRNRGVGESCIENEDCYIRSSDVPVHCDGFVCSCLNGTHVSSDRSTCINDQNEIGGFCIGNEDCTTENSICADKSCVCAENHYQSEGKCLPGNFANCNQNLDCKVPNSVCRNGTCGCHNEHVAASVNLCVPVVPLEAPCKHHIQCSSRTPNSFCRILTPEPEGELEENETDLAGTCACGEGFYHNFEGCFRKRVLKETCQNIAECYIESNQNSVLCKNGICSCNFGWRAINDSHCESGGARMSSRTWMLLIVLGVLCTHTSM